MTATFERKAGRDGNLMPKKVMIVEDNELNMKLFRDLIEASGYETVRTRNGLEALDLARLHKPDLILMDIQLPEVSGLEVTKWLKEDDDLHVIPVIAVTAFAMKGDEERIRQAAGEPGFLAGVLQFILAHEPTLMRFAAETGTPPASVGKALRALPLGDDDHEHSI